MANGGWPTKITITKDGKEFTGAYRVRRGVVIVTTLKGTKAGWVVGSTAEALARRLLLEMIDEGTAQ